MGFNDVWINVRLYRIMGLASICLHRYATGFHRRSFFSNSRAQSVFLLETSLIKDYLLKKLKVAVLKPNDIRFILKALNKEKNTDYTWLFFVDF